MSPLLRNAINLARNRLYGTTLTQQELDDQRRQAEIDEFKMYLARKIDVDIRLELFLPAEWLPQPGGAQHPVCGR